jgi:peptidoglycan/xylan/chitin deacetylase (PgdA/CDA1 family)
VKRGGEETERRAAGRGGGETERRAAGRGSEETEQRAAEGPAAGRAAEGPERRGAGRGGGIKAVLRIATLAVLICALLFSLLPIYRLAALNRSLRARIEVLNNLLSQQQTEIDGLNERLAASGGTPRAPAPSASGVFEPAPGASGSWEPAPPRLWPEHRDYQELCPSLYVRRSERLFSRDKAVYLTFDDGPTIYTERILDTLKEHDVKATFFVVGSSVTRLGAEGEALLRRMAEEGHTIGVHCNVHDYKRVYASVEAFLDDFNAAFTLIGEITGLRPDIFRFPGGSVNDHNTEIGTALIDEMARRGFTYYDWNASSNDAGRGVTEDSAWRNAVSRAGIANRVILLMHDTKKPTAEALARIIVTYKSQGYDFARLTNVDKPITL